MGAALAAPSSTRTNPGVTRLPWHAAFGRRTGVRHDRAAARGQPDYLSVQPGRGAGPVPPPAVGARTHHVGDIYHDCHQMPADPYLLRTVS